jgi:hypothetical protein
VGFSARQLGPQDPSILLPHSQSDRLLAMKIASPSSVKPGIDLPPYSYILQYDSNSPEP